MYAVEYTKEARKALRSLPRNLAAQIVRKIEHLAADPYAPNANIKRLSGERAYRLRVGDWRVIYEIQDEALLVSVVRVSPRGGAYR